MKRALGVPLALGLILAGCAPVTPETPQPTPRSAQTPQASLIDLAGHWRVAGIDGAPVDESYALALEGDARSIWWNPRCAAQVVPYRVEGTVFLPEPAPGTYPAPVCAIGLPGRLPDAISALRSGTRIERTASNGVLVSGGGRSILLFSQ